MPTSPQTLTPSQQAAAATSVILAIAEAIRALGQVPSGHLYARLMSKLSLNQYERVIGTLINAGLVEQTPASLLIWKGPAK